MVTSYTPHRQAMPHALESGLMAERGESLLSVDDAARLCGVSRDTIKRRLRAGEFPNAVRVRVPGPKGPWRIPDTDLTAVFRVQSVAEDPVAGTDVTALRIQLAIAHTR